MAKSTKSAAKSEKTDEAAGAKSETERPFDRLIPTPGEWGALVALVPIGLMFCWIRELGFGHGVGYDVLSRLKFVSKFPDTDLIVDLPAIAVQLFFLCMGRLLVPLRRDDLGKYPPWVRSLAGGYWAWTVRGAAVLLPLVGIATLIWGTGGSATLNQMTFAIYLAVPLLMIAGSPMLQYGLAKSGKWALYGIVLAALAFLTYLSGQRYGQSLLEFPTDSSPACLTLKDEAEPRMLDILRSYPSGRLVREKGDFIRWIADDDVSVAWTRPDRKGPCPNSGKKSAAKS